MVQRNNVRIDPEQYQALLKRLERTGIPIAESVRQALRAAIQKWSKE
jgi:hypothetical protein